MIATNLCNTTEELDLQTLLPHIKEVEIHRYLDMLIYTLTDDSVILADQFGYGEADNIEDGCCVNLRFWNSYEAPFWAYDIESIQDYLDRKENNE